MAPTPNKTCDHCRDPFYSRFKTAKVCVTCRILRDAPFIGATPHNCEWCSGEFWPARKNHTKCYLCMDPKAGEHKDIEPCILCGRHNKKAAGMKETCAQCVQESQEYRKEYFAALQVAKLKRKALQNTA